MSMSEKEMTALFAVSRLIYMGGAINNQAVARLLQANSLADVQQAVESMSNMRNNVRVTERLQILAKQMELT